MNEELRRVLILGGGLLGTSFALAVHRACPDAVLECIEPNSEHAARLAQLGVSKHIYSRPAEVTATCDLAVLAAPSSVCVAHLDFAARHATFVMDVCSIKQPLCDAAESLHLHKQFVPSHPMAGKAIEGPVGADASLFVDKTWLFLEDWTPPAVIVRLVEAVGAKPFYVADAAAHDAMVACVSHGIHITSLSAMLANDDWRRAKYPGLPDVSGPAFWDITRLASSPAAFWADTLIANADNVVQYLQTLQMYLSRFEQALSLRDKENIVTLLETARLARNEWSDNPHS